MRSGVRGRLLGGTDTPKNTLTHVYVGTHARTRTHMALSDLTHGSLVATRTFYLGADDGAPVPPVVCGRYWQVWVMGLGGRKGKRGGGIDARWRGGGEEGRGEEGDREAPAPPLPTSVTTTRASAIMAGFRGAVAGSGRIRPCLAYSLLFYSMLSCSVLF